jgi:hypothetical protein
MNPLPLFVRELVVAGRRSSTHRLKLAFGGGSMLVALWALLLAKSGTGLPILHGLTWMAALMAVFAAIAIASDTISRERRDGTLGFLFLTDLSAVDLVLGKFAAAGLLPAMGLVAMFPAFATCLLVGGVPVGLFWKTMAALVLTLIFSLSAAICVSSFCEDHRKAFGGTTILLLVASPLWLVWFAQNLSLSSFIGLAITFAVGAGCLLYWSAKRLLHCWRDDERTAESRGSERRDELSPALLEKFPVAWMMQRRQRENRRWAMLGFGVVIVALLLSLPMWRFRWDLLLALLAIHIGYEFILIARTAYFFYADRQTGALELLLGSRLLNEEIFEGLNQYLVRRSVFFISMLTVVDLAIALALWSGASQRLAALPLALAGGLWITLFGLGWLGVYRSLMMKHPSLAMLATFARLSLLPMLLSILFLQVPGTDFVRLAFFHVVASGFLAAFFAMDAKVALIEHGRTLLLRPYSEPAPHIENKWSFIEWDEGAEERSYVPN